MIKICWYALYFFYLGEPVYQVLHYSAPLWLLSIGILHFGAEVIEFDVQELREADVPQEQHEPLQALFEVEGQCWGGGVLVCIFIF